MSVLEVLSYIYIAIAISVFVYEMAYLITKTESFENNGVLMMLLVVAVISILWPVSIFYTVVTRKGLQ